ncbi:hypothetical protein [Burkholderia anthina]|uniref:hypothetical protein n=1 Tax=Burkholderia anthina TaxID=179879 RepID=UPI00292F7B97|nr:hypothetical protein [Burkholderia anthina]WJN74412.1 hypothetical protein OH687_29305 [Burkholderia anthina]
MSDPILSRDQILKIVRKTLKENNDRDKLSAQRFVEFATAIEAAVLEKVCGEPYLYVYEYDRGGYVHRQLHAGMWNGARESRSIPLFALTRRKP